MTPSHGNRFEDFFADDAYLALKNLLYNYRLRKRAVRKCLQRLEKGLVLEVGSGLSPMVTDSDHVIYSEISFAALRNLKKSQASGFFVVADATSLPFKTGTFEQVVCSEVLEHLPDDKGALREMASVMKPGASLIVTFPHRRGYYAGDDRFVSHLRRYEVREMEERLQEAGLNPVEIKKVLGPLEKVTMLLVTSILSFGWRSRYDRRIDGEQAGLLTIIVPLFGWINHLLSGVMWLDARLAPRFLSTVILIRSIKSGRCSEQETPA